MAIPGKVDDLEMVKCLGKGFFGEVYHAKEKTSKQRSYAVKKVTMSLIKENRLAEQLQREIKLLESLQHPRIVKLYFHFEDSKFMYLGMELVSGGSLFDRLNKQRKFTPEFASRCFAETCDALDYLHHLPEKVIHRDIKPENILLDAEDHVKLADFGWANMLQGSLRETFCGTLDYLAPEMITGTGHDESVDMWNMGVLLYELTTGQSPFGSPNKETTCRLILNVDLRFPTEMDVDAKDLVCGLCKKKAQDRLDVRAALQHRFVTKYNGGAPAPVDGAGEEGDEIARPSVVARRLRKDREKISAEMTLLLQSKQKTEDELFEVNSKIEETTSSCRKEVKMRQKFEAECEVICKENAERERELEDLRKQVEALKADVIKNGGKIKEDAPKSFGLFGRR